MFRGTVRVEADTVRDTQSAGSVGVFFLGSVTCLRGTTARVISCR
ncbi:MAG: hypothetical protein U5J64_01250 [Halobacteriales archaeon]|nr:hypothetical protein [Halobacteriales archaeon]